VILVSREEDGILIYSKFSLSSTLLSTCALLLRTTIYSNVWGKNCFKGESNLYVYPFGLKNPTHLVGFFAI